MNDVKMNKKSPTDFDSHQQSYQQTKCKFQCHKIINEIMHLQETNFLSSIVRLLLHRYATLLRELCSYHGRFMVSSLLHRQEFD